MVGVHLIESLLSEPSTRVIGTRYNPTASLPEFSRPVDFRCIDVRYFRPIQELLQAERPDVIFHLAAQSYPNESWLRSHETLEVNCMGTLNLLDAIRQIKSDDLSYNPVIVVACSSAQYGQTMMEARAPVSEDAAMLPLTPYGVSKVCQDLLSYQFFQSHGLKVIRARIFNTTGPHKTGDVLSDFVQRAVLKKQRPSYQFTVGNLDTVRSITDVRDLVRALVLLSEHGQSGEAYNICSDATYSVMQMLETVEKVAGFPLDAIQDPALLRPTDERIIFGDSAKLRQVTGWAPVYSLLQTVSDMYDTELRKREDANES